MRKITLCSTTLAVSVGIAAALLPQAASAGALVTHKSPFNCGKTFNANNWTGGHSPSGSIDWQNYGSDAINGETVRATAAGTATFKDAGSTSYGKWVEIRHSDGTRTRYAHLSSMVRSAGGTMTVSQGTVIGTVGSTGGSTAPHLHYEQQNASGGMITKPVVEGVAVSLGTKKAIKSTNGCGGGSTATSGGGGSKSTAGNPYTPEKVCGSGFKVIDSAAVTGGRVYLLYNSANRNNCVTTMKTSGSGSATMSAFLEPKGASRSTDKGSYQYYAGPVKKAAPSQCVKWGGSIGSSSYTSPFEHCG